MLPSLSQSQLSNVQLLPQSSPVQHRRIGNNNNHDSANAGCGPLSSSSSTANKGNASSSTASTSHLNNNNLLHKNKNHHHLSNDGYLHSGSNSTQLPLLNGTPSKAVSTSSKLLSSSIGGGRGSGCGGGVGVAGNTNSSSLASMSTGAPTHRGSMVRLPGAIEGNGDSQVSVRGDCSRRLLVGIACGDG